MWPSVLLAQHALAGGACVSGSLTQRPLMADLSYWQVWPGQTVFPDYTSENCIEWWVDEYKRFSEEVKHDALWIVSVRGATMNA